MDNSQYIVWNADPEIFNLLGFSVKYYGMLFITGLLLSVFILKKIFKSQNLEETLLDKLTIYGVLGIVLGARLGHCFFYDFSYFKDHPIEILIPVQEGPDGKFHFTGFQGLASHGGAIGLMLSVWLFCRKYKVSFLQIIDYIAIVTPLAGFFIRMANFMNSEIIGSPSTAPWAIIFIQVDDIPRHPSQLYEAIAYLFIFFIIFYLYKKMNQQIRHGFYLGVSLGLIFIARFFIEFLKEKQVEFEENMALDMGQWLSIPFIFVGGYLIYQGYFKKRVSE